MRARIEDPQMQKRPELKLRPRAVHQLGSVAVADIDPFPAIRRPGLAPAIIAIIVAAPPPGRAPGRITESQADAKANGPAPAPPAVAPAPAAAPAPSGPSPSAAPSGKAASSRSKDAAASPHSSTPGRGSRARTGAAEWHTAAEAAKPASCKAAAEAAKPAAGESSTEAATAECQGRFWKRQRGPEHSR